MTCIILAWDRFLEIAFPDIAKKVFGKKMMPFWLAMPPLYMAYCNFFIPVVFNTIQGAFYTDPFYRIPELEGNENVIFKNIFLWDLVI